MSTKTQIVSPGTRQTARAAHPHPQNRHMLSLALVPLILLAANSCFAWAQRAVVDGKGSGDTSEIEARQVARDTVLSVSRLPVLSMEATPRKAYTRGGAQPVHEWDILCRTNAGDYQIRIESDTCRVFAINQVVDEDAVLETVGVPLSSQQAEKQARAYARVLGIAPRSLCLDRSAQTWKKKWDFTYHRRVPGHGVHSVKVMLNQTGGLESVWNPMRTL